MKQTTKWFVIYLAVLALLPAAVPAIEPPHDAGNSVSCMDCHEMVLTGGVMSITTPRGAEQEAVCQACHNPGGQAASMANVANHLVNGGSTIVDCGSCHDPHSPDITVDPHTGVEAANLSLIRKTPRHVDGALDLAVYQQDPEHFAFGEGGSPWNGICQVCHTATAHHTNDSSADHDHEIGSNCTGCHPHANGFAASGGSCEGCHSAPQDNGDGVPAGGRRAAASEFPAGSAGLHAHYGAALGADACLVCHSVGTHMDGYVELVDPDNASLIYRFVDPADLNSDPDLSTFCAGCHDGDGAQRLASPLDPFGNGNAPPDVASRFMGSLQWDEYYGDSCFGYEGTLRQVNSHHDISDSDQAWSGSKIECLNCHGAHNASADTPIADPNNQAQVWAGAINDFCLSCHAGGNGPMDPGFPAGGIGTDVAGPAVAMRGLDTGNCDYNMAPWWVDYTWTFSPHGLDSKRYWDGYPNVPGSDAVLDCTVCHDPHGSYTAANTEGNPYMIRDFVDGTPFIDDGNRPNPATWGAAPGTAGSVVVTVSGTDVDWGSSQSLCTKCHATWLDSYSWHAYCNGCQSCHGHGQTWDGYDWGPGNDDHTSCAQIGVTGASLTASSAGQFGAASAAHDNTGAANCSECHVGHSE